MNNPNRYRAIFYAAALVLFGAIIGAMVMSRISGNPQTLRLGRVDEIATLIRQRLEGKLDLTPEQKVRIEPMIRKAAEEMEASHRDCLVRVNRAADNLHKEIKPELIPEQQQKLLELESERAGRMLDKYSYQSASTGLKSNEVRNVARP